MKIRRVVKLDLVGEFAGDVGTEPVNERVAEMIEAETLRIGEDVDQEEIARERRQLGQVHVVRKRHFILRPYQVIPVVVYAGQRARQLLGSGNG